MVEPTAPDASNQNGLAERPHKTLKERVRCLLYTAGLGILFWADALLHSVWLYNRTYHSRIEQTPFQAYTKRIPTLDGLITFGCRVTPKKAGRRNTATNPNSYDGIFLGYRATQDNIRYWDTNAQRERSATHMAKDEVQYGDPPERRSPASKHLIEVITGTPHTQRRTDILLDNSKASTDFQSILTEPGIEPDHNLMTIDDSPLPFTAAAAKVTAKHGRKHEDILTHELLLMDITTNIHEPAVSETLPLQEGHPTLGLITEQHPEYLDTITLTRCDPGTASHKQITRWKTRHRGSTTRMADAITINDIEQVTETIRLKRLK